MYKYKNYEKKLNFKGTAAIQKKSGGMFSNDELGVVLQSCGFLSKAGDRNLDS